MNKLFYLASTLKNWKFANKAIEIIERATGHTNTFNWTEVYKQHLKSGAESVQNEHVWRDLAQREIDAVQTADYMVLLLPGGIGTHVELGVAFASSVPVYLLGSSKHKHDDRGPDIFLYVNGVTDMTFDYAYEPSYLSGNELLATASLYTTLADLIPLVRE